MPIPVLPAVPSTIDAARAQGATRDRVGDHRHRRAVLDRPARVHEFRLAENCASRGLGSGPKLDERRAANRGDNIAYRLHRGSFGLKARRVGDSASCDKPPPLPQGARRRGARRRCSSSSRKYSGWSRRRSTSCCSARLLGVALLWPTRPLRPRPCLDGDPHSACGRDPAGRHAADRAVGRPLPHSARPI